jgi:hypothetical protein
MACGCTCLMGSRVPCLMFMLMFNVQCSMGTCMPYLDNMACSFQALYLDNMACGCTCLMGSRVPYLHTHFKGNVQFMACAGQTWGQLIPSSYTHIIQYGMQVHMFNGLLHAMFRQYGMRVPIEHSRFCKEKRVNLSISN